MPRLPLACFLVTFAPLAFAHPPLPHADWCETGRVEVVGQFAYDGRGLADALADYCDNSPRNCGEFDGYERAMTFIDASCDAYQGPISHGDVGDVIPVVLAPQSYLVNTHHATYVVGDGLYGYCLRCTLPRAQAPVAPGPVPTR